MAHLLLRLIEEDLAAGTAPELAIARAEGSLRAALAENPGRNTDILRQWGAMPIAREWRWPDLRVTVPHDGDPETVPTASCLRRELSGIQNPTRDDIQRAMRACLGGRP